MKKISVLLVDDHTIVRQGLKALLTQDAGIEVVGEAENGNQAVEMAAKTKPDIVIMDVAMPFMNGLDATRQVLKTLSSTKVLVLSSYGEDDHVQQLIDAGAAGYLLKATAATDLQLAIREIHKGNAFFSPSIVKRQRERARRAFDDGRAHRKNMNLTAREAQVLQLIADGRANKQAAAELGISIKTIEKHRQQVMNKLNIHDVAGLTRYAVSKRGMEPAVSAP